MIKVFSWISFLIIIPLLSFCALKNERNTQDLEDFVFAIDLSSSMLARDFVPNRIEAVKGILRKIIREKGRHQNISIVLFAGEGGVLCPLTKNSNLLLDRIDKIEIGIIQEGTAIGLGIMLGLYELSKSKSKKKEIVLFTDGVNNLDAFSPEIAAQIAYQHNIQIHSFGIGCNGKAVAPVSRRSDGKFVFGERTVSIDEELLKSVGDLTYGNYTRITCTADLEQLAPRKMIKIMSDSLIGGNDSISDNIIDSLLNEVNLINEVVIKKIRSN